MKNKLSDFVRIILYKTEIICLEHSNFSHLVETKAMSYQILKRKHNLYQNIGAIIH